MRNSEEEQLRLYNTVASELESAIGMWKEHHYKATEGSIKTMLECIEEMDVIAGYSVTFKEPIDELAGLGIGYMGCSREYAIELACKRFDVTEEDIESIVPIWDYRMAR